MMRAFLLALLCCVCLTPILAAQWVSRSTTLATIYTQPGDERLAAASVAVVDDETLRVAEAIGLHSVRRFPVYLYTNQTEFLRDSGLNPHLVGVSYSPSGLIRIDATNIRGSMRTILAHEITHTLLNQRLGNSYGELPLWVNEGMAGFLSEPISQDTLPYLAHRQHTSGVQSIDEMERAFTVRQSSDAAYLQSASMIAWLEYRHPGALQRILSQMVVGDSFYHALGDVTGLTPEEWLRQWKKGISSLDLWLNIANSPVIFAPIAILIAVIALLRGRRRDDEEEDDEEDADSPAPTGLHTAPVAAHLAQYPIWDDIYTP